MPELADASSPSGQTNRRADTWTEHRDINEVMPATALIEAFAETARPFA